MSLVSTAIRHDFVKRFATYFLVGGICAVTDLVLFYAGINAFGLHYLTAGTISFLLATGLNYLLCVRYVFDGGNRSRGALVILVYLVSAVGILVNLFVLGTLIEFADVNPVFAKITATGITFFWNFGSRNFIVFARKRA